jgi:hypothetical protein
VMFCDLVDSTGIATRLDAEEWRDLVSFVTASTLHGASPATLLGSAQRNFFNMLGTGALMARIRRAGHCAYPERISSQFIEGHRPLPFRERFEPPTAFRIIGKPEASCPVREGSC